MSSAGNTRRHKFPSIISGEVWADVPSYEGIYEVSTFGRVRSLPRVVGHPLGLAKLKGRILRTSLQNKYPSVALHSGTGRKKDRRVHTMVAEVFMPKPAPGLELNHKDLNKENPRLDNLEWVTHKENAEHAKLHGALNAATNPNRAKKLNVEKVACIRAARDDGMAYSKIAAKFEIGIATAHEIVTRKIWG